MTGNPDKSVPLVERAFAVCALLYGSTAFIRLLVGTEEYSAVGEESLASPTKRILWLLVYCGATYFLFKQRRSIRNALRGTTLLILLLLAYVASSVLWSGSKMISILSIAALAGNSLTGFYLGVRYSSTGLLRLLGWFCGIVALATLFSPMFIRDYAMDPCCRNGFFANKNTLGMTMVIGFLVFVMLSRSAKTRKWLCGVFAALCAVLVFLSGSTTCIIILFALACAIVLHGSVERWGVSTLSRALSIALILVFLVVIGLSYWQQILNALGNSETFLGRVGLWAVLVSMARDKLFVGYGYGGFWVFGGPAQAIWDYIDPGEAEYAHNGYIQVLMDCGIIGLVLLLVLLFRVFANARNHLRVTGDFWPLYFVLFLLLYNLTEATFLVRNSVCWLLFVAVTVQLAQALPMEMREGVPIKNRYPKHSAIFPASA